MTSALRSAELPEVVYRLGRLLDPWEWPDWTYAREDGTFGNRYDDPEGQYRVLYASAERQTTFRECLARFRPDLAVIAVEIEEDDQDAPSTLPPGRVKRSWLARRLMGTATIDGRYCDVGHSESVQHLREALAARIIHYGLDDLDAGDLRRRAPWRLTQEISRCPRRLRPHARRIKDPADRGRSHPSLRQGSQPSLRSSTGVGA